jgi:ATP-dependent DNA ligase
VRLFTRNGHDWTDRYPLIAEAALRNRATSFVIDGEAVLLGVDGISDFNGLHSRRHNNEVQLCAFDILALGGEDLRALPLYLRKTNLARLLARRPDGIFVSDFEQGEIGPDLFRHACKFGLEGMVSKRRESRYRAGRSPDWIKVKNRKHPRAGQGEGIFLMRKGPDGRGRETTVARLLARKQQILERPQENLSPEERDEIERQLAQIDTALNLLDEAGPDKTNDE